MRTRLGAAAIAAALALPFTLATTAAPAPHGGDDVTVIAVVDNAFNPYHLDWVAEQMPQHRDADETNDLPLDTAPDEWLAGFDASGFATYDRLDLTMPTTPAASRSTLQAQDSGEWAKVKRSSADEVNYYWVPDSKIVGVVDFAGNGLVSSGTAHGSGTSSVSAGNFYGTCAQCVVVFITNGSSPSGEAAGDWAMSQPWIDVVTNSFGYSLILRDRYYGGSNTDLQRQAAERGQTVFFSAGNGQANTFTAPNTTLLSSQEGPDWIVTVGAVNPNGGSYTGHGKPADVASLGTDYPSSYCTSNAFCNGTFGGTSNATPVVAGIYANALAEARKALPGPSRTQAEGVIAVGEGFACGEVRPDCELGDGQLTAVELRERLFGGAVHTAAGYAPLGLVGSSTTQRISWEHEFLNEGHGTYFGRYDRGRHYAEELGRIVGPMLGTAATLERPEGESDWFIVDSYCRQTIWGSWSNGDYVEGETALPDYSPLWPLRGAYQGSCPGLAAARP